MVLVNATNISKMCWFQLNMTWLDYFITETFWRYELERKYNVGINIQQLLYNRIYDYYKIYTTIWEKNTNMYLQ